VNTELAASLFIVGCGMIGAVLGGLQGAGLFVGVALIAMALLWYLNK
jgi:hypothetical protein